jgi:hypothetical protein
MLLQVHDELVFEAPKDEADDLIKLARETMSGRGGAGAVAISPAGGRRESGRHLGPGALGAEP